MMVLWPSSPKRQFIGGSDDNPVSTAGIQGATSPQASSNESNPDFDPYMPNHGVHTCAGTTKKSGSASRANSAKRIIYNPRMGRPSDASFPTFPSSAFKRGAASREGAKSNTWTLRSCPPREKIHATSDVYMKSGSWDAAVFWGK